MITIKKVLKRFSIYEVAFEYYSKNLNKSNLEIKTFYRKKDYKNFIKNGDSFFKEEVKFADDYEFIKSFKGRLTKDNNDIVVTYDFPIRYSLELILRQKKFYFIDSAFVRHLSFIWHLKNFILCLRYPFYKSRNRWSDRFSGYSYTEYDSIPVGWRTAFGKQLSKDLKQALKKDKCLRKFRFEQIKEKFGSLRLYAHGYGDNTKHVLDKYELLSQGYCICCGKPARYATRYWIEYYCEDCFYKQEKVENNDEYRAECRLTKDDIPEFTNYEYQIVHSMNFDTKEEAESVCKNLEDKDDKYFYAVHDNEDGSWRVDKSEGVRRVSTPKEQYEIDFEELWGLK